MSFIHSPSFLRRSVISLINASSSSNRRNNTKTEGMSSACFLTHTGEISPSGYSGDVGFNGLNGL